MAENVLHRGAEAIKKHPVAIVGGVAVVALLIYLVSSSGSSAATTAAPGTDPATLAAEAQLAGDRKSVV